MEQWKCTHINMSLTVTKKWIFSEIDEPLDFNEYMSNNNSFWCSFLEWCCSLLWSYLFLKLFILYVILKKLRFQYFLSIACYKETKYIIECVSVIPIDDLTDILS